MIANELVKKELEFRKVKPLSNEFLKESIEKAIKKIDLMMEVYTDCFPSSASENLVYPKIDNTQWTTAFWPGMLWLAYEYTNDEKYRNLAEKLIDKYEERLDKEIRLDTHDLGFLYTLACLAPYKLTGNERAKKIALRAADVLITRYHEKAGIIQAWGDLNDPAQRGRMIIDCNMNLPLLYWATEMTGDQKYRDVALNHLKQSRKNIIREDASTHHTFFFDTETGEPIGGKTFQGFSDDSAWSRGQGWGVYGLALSYNYTNDYTLIETSKKLANYFINRVPEDLVAYWDLIFTEGNEPRDSSATAIVACGLLEVLKHLPQDDKDRGIYEGYVNQALTNLSTDYFSNSKDETGLILHGTYCNTDGRGVDEFCIWGDYYYLEALIRKYKDWNLYW